jgi:hypothetical protein
MLLLLLLLLLLLHVPVYATLRTSEQACGDTVTFGINEAQ